MKKYAPVLLLNPEMEQDQDTGYCHAVGGESSCTKAGDHLATASDIGGIAKAT